VIHEEGFAWNGKTYGSLSQNRQGDDGDELERPSVLWTSTGKGGGQGPKASAPRTARERRTTKESADRAVRRPQPSRRCKPKMSLNLNAPRSRRMRHEGSADKTQPALYDQYPGLHRPGARTGLQLDRRPQTEITGAKRRKCRAILEAWKLRQFRATSWWRTQSGETGLRLNIPCYNLPVETGSARLRPPPPIPRKPR